MFIVILNSDLFICSSATIKSNFSYDTKRICESWSRYKKSNA